MSRFKDKFGNEIPDEALDDYEGPPERPNAVRESLGGDAFVDEFVKELEQAVEQQPAIAPVTPTKPQ